MKTYKNGDATLLAHEDKDEKKYCSNAYSYDSGFYLNYGDVEFNDILIYNSYSDSKRDLFGYLLLGMLWTFGNLIMFRTNMHLWDINFHFIKNPSGGNMKKGVAMIGVIVYSFR